ncbi:histidine kinase [Dactylosporangium sp. NBC_01737]|uniref:sensor histidine kinase n=1 Tax=Dactylosporangium sp. NBC_01737 TaxID=2975959 RepID=UPI002E163441|nr:histidine kinase [Dactylosporangium sp. NBC_01737]
MSIPAVLRRPGLQDAGLAALLLIGSWVGNGTTAGGLGGPPASRWFLIGICVAAVAVRRRWPVPSLAAASLAAVAQMALAETPVPADLAVPVAMYTVAVQWRRAVSLALLGAALAVVTAWSAYVALDGRADGWLDRSAMDTARERGPQDAPPPAGEPTFGPTDWGGLPVLGSMLVVAWAIGWGVHSRRAYLGELLSRAREQAALAGAEERARITRELHDVVAHGLAVIVMQAQGGTAAFAKRPADTLAALDTIVATGRASLAEMRHVLRDGPAQPVPGLVDLPGLVEQVRRAGTPVDLRVDGSPRPLPTGVDVSAYRIVQEALTNTMKHAGPGARATVVVSYGSAELRLDAGDDGTGTPAGGGTGSGLRGMRERAALLGGEVTAGPGPDGGYRVRARIPLDPAGTG